MDELRKMHRVLARELPGAPHEVLLILDATVGQNALSQAKQFREAVGVTGLALTKLDGTARGGVVVAIGRELKIPMRLIGVGERVEDLQDFHAEAFVDALFAGTAPDGGLYMPERFDPLPAETLAAIRESSDIVEIASLVGAHIFRDEMSAADLAALVKDALDFPVPLEPVSDRVWALELFHGPTLAFKDVGARVQARLLHHFTDGTPLTILVATSGDTGSAVAQAFHRVPDTRVVVLYPEGKVSDVQEAQMASLGGNITAVSVRGTFDDCQRLVKQAFADDDLRAHVWLTPANSINLGRLLPQVFYYFLLAKLGASAGGPLVRDDADLERFRETYRIPRFEPAALRPEQVVRAVIGMDGGSTSSKAVLMDEDDPFAPSDEDTFEKLKKVGERRGVLYEQIDKDDLPVLAEYDALFIRTVKIGRAHV